MDRVRLSCRSAGAALRDALSPGNLAFLGASGGALWALGLVEAVLLCRGRAPRQFAFRFALHNALAGLGGGSRRAALVFRSLGLPAEEHLSDEAARRLRAEGVGTARRVLGALVTASEALYLHERGCEHERAAVEAALRGAAPVVAGAGPRALRLTTARSELPLDGDADVLPVLVAGLPSAAEARRLTRGGLRPAFLSAQEPEAWAASSLGRDGRVVLEADEGATREAMARAELAARAQGHAVVARVALTAPGAARDPEQASLHIDPALVVGTAVAEWCLRQEAEGPGEDRVLSVDTEDERFLEGLRAELARVRWSARRARSGPVLLVHRPSDAETLLHEPGPATLLLLRGADSPALGGPRRAVLSRAKLLGEAFALAREEGATQAALDRRARRSDSVTALRTDRRSSLGWSW